MCVVQCQGQALRARAALTPPCRLYAPLAYTIIDTARVYHFAVVKPTMRSVHHTCAPCLVQCAASRTCTSCTAPTLCPLAVDLWRQATTGSSTHALATHCDLHRKMHGAHVHALNACGRSWQRQPAQAPGTKRLAGWRQPRAHVREALSRFYGAIELVQIPGAWSVTYG